MIRVDSLEKYEELRKSGFTDDIMILMKGGETNEEAGASGEAGGPEGETGEAGEAGDSEEAAERKTNIQFDYDKIVKEVTEKLTPIIQKANRTAGAGGAGVTDEDNDLDAIMKKFADM